MEPVVRLSKIKAATENFKNVAKVLKCPHCQEVFEVDDQSLLCLNNHRYNLNRKGYVQFSKPLNDQLYTKDLFTARREIITSNIYEPFIRALKKYCDDTYGLVVDAGCGEGSFLKQVLEDRDKPFGLGLDLALSGIDLASDDINHNYLVADLANMPLQDQSGDLILNILSPANYTEFQRILKDDGHLIKVIPNENYLKEIRDLTTHSDYSNDEVLNILNDKMDIISSEDVTYTVEITRLQSEQLLAMTPMSNHQTYTKQLTEITIDLRICLCRKKV
ncbi:MAG: methyltransferase domain-containing protein [Erysipelothrix sp.]|nr:methyltransferase domain-containing protein [Erysipelothrix sp.]